MNREEGLGHEEEDSLFGNNIIPFKPRSDSLFGTTREYYEEFYEKDSTKLFEEIQLIGVAEQREFLCLIKNEPLKYISICEFNDTVRELVQNRFKFFITRNQINHNLEIDFYYDDYNSKIKFKEKMSDHDVIEDLVLNIRGLMSMPSFTTKNIPTVGKASTKRAPMQKTPNNDKRYPMQKKPNNDKRDRMQKTPNNDKSTFQMKNLIAFLKKLENIMKNFTKKIELNFLKKFCV